MSTTLYGLAISLVNHIQTRIFPNLWNTMTDIKTEDFATVISDEYGEGIKTVNPVLPEYHNIVINLADDSDSNDGDDDDDDDDDADCDRSHSITVSKAETELCQKSSTIQAKQTVETRLFSHGSNRGQQTENNAEVIDLTGDSSDEEEDNKPKRTKQIDTKDVQQPNDDITMESDSSVLQPSPISSTCFKMIQLPFDDTTHSNTNPFNNVIGAGFAGNNGYIYPSFGYTSPCFSSAMDVSITGDTRKQNTVPTPFYGKAFLNNTAMGRIEERMDESGSLPMMLAHGYPVPMVFGSPAGDFKRVGDEMDVDFPDFTDRQNRMEIETDSTVKPMPSPMEIDATRLNFNAMQHQQVTCFSKPNEWQSRFINTNVKYESGPFMHSKHQPLIMVSGQNKGSPMMIDRNQPNSMTLMEIDPVQIKSQFKWIEKSAGDQLDTHIGKKKDYLQGLFGVFHNFSWKSRKRFASTELNLQPSKYRCTHGQRKWPVEWRRSRGKRKSCEERDLEDDLAMKMRRLS